MSRSRKRGYGGGCEIDVVALEKAPLKNILLNAMKIHRRRINPIFAKI